MGAHIDKDGKFQSDKYPTCPAGKVPLSVTDPTAQDLLWTYAQRRRPVDAEFSDDLEACLKAAGYVPSAAPEGKPMTPTKTVTITLTDLKDPDEWGGLIEKLGLSTSVRDKHFRWSEYADVELVIDQDLTIVGGRILPQKR